MAPSRISLIALAVAAGGCGRLGYDPTLVDGGAGDLRFDDPSDSGAVIDQARFEGSGGDGGETYIKASNTAAGAQFGYAIALSADGSTLAVGAYYEDSAATGIDGDQSDHSAPQSGAVYIYTRAGASWSQQAYIKPSNTEAHDQFGVAVSLSADGSTLSVGANGEASGATGIDGNQSDDSASFSGAVYVFTRSGATWSQQAYLKASNTHEGTQLGRTLALSTDGNTLAAGAFGEGSAATGINGDQADNSAPQSGAVYVYTRAGTTWSQQAYVKASNCAAHDFFGIAAALSADGNTLAVGAYFESGAATGVNGNQADQSALNSGAVYLFTRSGATWSQQAYVKASNTEAGDLFGVAIALSGDGLTLTVGAIGEASSATGIGGNQSDNSAPMSGAVYVFHEAESLWSQEAYLKASNTAANDGFGDSIAVSSDGNRLAVGAVGESSAASGIDGNQSGNSDPKSGATYVFTRAGATWSQAAYLKAADSAAGDLFGFPVALSADASTLAVGALGEGSAATGVGGNQRDDSASGSGAVYLVE